MDAAPGSKFSSWLGISPLSLKQIASAELFAPLLSLWNAHPALLPGICLCFGASWAHFGLERILLPLLLFFGTLLPSAARILFSSLLILTSQFYFSLSPPLPAENGLQGMAEVSLISPVFLRSMSSPRTSIRAQLRHLWKQENGEFKRVNARGVPLTVVLPSAFLSKKEFHSLLARDWLMTGKLYRSSSGAWRWEVTAKDRISPSEQTRISLFPVRRGFRASLYRILSRHMEEGLPKALLFGLLTGEVEDPQLTHLFQRLSLQHILAISGFHFSVLAFLFAMAGQLLLPLRASLLLTLTACSLYGCAIGPCPSVVRAWVMAFCGQLGHLLGRTSPALNRLGIAAMAILLWNSHAVLEKGFWLSFLITGSILLFFPLFNGLMPLLERRGFLARTRSLMYSGLALGLSVNAAALPLMLYYFHRFPLWGLLYNLFFPFLVAGSICLSFLAIVCSLFWTCAADRLFFLVEAYTGAILFLPESLPPACDLWIRIPSFPLWILQGFLGISLLTGILLRKDREADRLFP